MHAAGISTLVAVVTINKYSLRQHRQFVSTQPAFTKIRLPSVFGPAYHQSAAFTKQLKEKYTVTSQEKVEKQEKHNHPQERHLLLRVMYVT